MADLYAMAIELDRVRFGSLTFLAAGERLRVKGSYEYDRRKIFESDERRPAPSFWVEGLQPRVVARL